MTTIVRSTQRNSYAALMMFWIAYLGVALITFAPKDWITTPQSFETAGESDVLLQP